VGKGGPAVSVCDGFEPPLPTLSRASIIDSVGKDGIADLTKFERLGRLCPPYDAAAHGYASNTLPPVRSGERMKATAAWVATACLMERSTMNSSSS
jgi:hypothetical protein